MTIEGCERSRLLDLAREGRLPAADAAALAEHRLACGTCQEHHAADEQIRRLVRSLPSEPFDQGALPRVWNRVLLDVAGGEARLGSRRWPWRHTLLIACAFGGLVGVVALAAVTPRRPSTITVAVASVSASTAYAGDVTADPGARWTQERDGGVEHVRLAEGRVVVHVRKQAPEERFYVDVPDGLLEVRGTTFEVVATTGGAEAVSVTEGRVALRVSGAPQVELGAGEHWRRATSPRSSSRPITQGSAPHASPVIDTETAEYEAAIASYRAGDYSDAAARFRRFDAAHPRSALLEDATFLEASSLARLGRTEEAGRAAEHHLALFPRSFHERDAAALVARSSRQPR